MQKPKLVLYIFLVEASTGKVSEIYYGRADKMTSKFQELCRRKDTDPSWKFDINSDVAYSIADLKERHPCLDWSGHLRPRLLL